MSDRVFNTVCQTRFSDASGAIDLTSYTTRSTHFKGGHITNFMAHIDSESRKKVTSTDHEQFGSSNGEAGFVRHFWDKRIPLSVKIRG